MKQFILFLIIAIFLLALPLAYAGELKDIVEFCYQNSDKTNRWLEYNGRNHVNLTQAVSKNQTGVFATKNESIEIDDSGNANANYFGTGTFDDDDNHSFICAWGNTTLKVGDHTIFHIGDITNNIDYLTFKINADTGKDQAVMQISGNAPGTNVVTWGSGLNQGGKFFLCIGTNNGTYWAFQNGTNKSVGLEAGGNNGDWSADLIKNSKVINRGTLGARDRLAGADNLYFGNLQGLIYGNGTPTTEQLGNLSNYTTGSSSGINPINCSNIYGGGSSSDSIVPFLTLEYPENYSVVNGVLYPLNISGKCTDNIACVNVTINNTLWGNNSGSNSSWLFINVSAVSAGNYTINITGSDVAGNKFIFIANFSVDFLSPVLTVNQPALFSSSESEGVYINVSAVGDYELFDYNVTCWNQSNFTLLSYYISDLNTSSYSTKLFLNWSNQSTQPMSCNVTVFDSHTLLKIPDAAVSLNPFAKSFGLTYPDGSCIIELVSASDISLFQSITYLKEESKYSFCYNFGKGAPLKSRTFRVSCGSKVYYKPFSKYRGHLISKPFYFDAEGQSGNLNFVKESETSYLMTDESPSENLCYSSFGRLNVAYSNFTISKTNPASSGGGGGGGAESRQQQSQNVVSSIQNLTYREILLDFFEHPGLSTADAIILYPLSKIIEFSVYVLNGFQLDPGLQLQTKFDYKQHLSDSLNTFIKFPSGSNLLTLLRSFLNYLLLSSQSSILQ